MGESERLRVMQSGSDSNAEIPCRRCHQTFPRSEMVFGMPMRFYASGWFCRSCYSRLARRDNYLSAGVFAIVIIFAWVLALRETPHPPHYGLLPTPPLTKIKPRRNRHSRRRPRNRSPLSAGRGDATQRSVIGFGYRTKNPYNAPLASPLAVA